MPNLVRRNGPVTKLLSKADTANAEGYTHCVELYNHAFQVDATVESGLGTFSVSIEGTLDVDIADESKAKWTSLGAALTTDGAQLQVRGVYTHVRAKLTAVDVGTKVTVRHAGN